MSLKVVCDARPAQQGFKAHAGRGIGRYCRELIRAMGAVEQPPDIRLLLQAGLGDPGLPARGEKLWARFGPAWWPGDKRLPSYHWLVRRPLARPWGSGEVVHFMTHMDAPALVGPRTVITVHDLILHKLEKLFIGKKSRARYRAERWLETRCLRRAAHILADSSHTKKDIVDILGVRPGRITVTPLAADPGLEPCRDAGQVEKALDKYGLGRLQGFFLYLGGVDHRKDLATLLSALADLKQRDMVHDLALAGKLRPDKAQKALEAHIEKLGMADSVHFLGYVDDADIPPLFAACRAFVYPSLYEGFGLPPLEAMACGAPVVASRAGSLPEVVGEAGILVEPGDVGGWAQALAAIAEGPELGEDLREQGLQRAAGFSWERTARQTLEVYREVARAD